MSELPAGRQLHESGIADTPLVKKEADGDPEGKGGRGADKISNL
jgi:hypothetical protein